MTLYTVIVFTIGILVGCCVGMAGAMVMYERMGNRGRT